MKSNRFYADKAIISMYLKNSSSDKWGIKNTASGRLRYDFIEKLIRKYYKRTEKQESLAAMVYGKINNLSRISEMLRTL